MRAQEACLSMIAGAKNIQDFDKSFKKAYGDLHPPYISRWDDQLFSMLFTGFGTVMNPTWRRSLKLGKPTLLDRLDARASRRNYQAGLLVVEDLITAAVDKHGPAKTAELLAQRTEIENHGAGLVDGLQHAGFRFKDADQLKGVFALAKRELAPARRPQAGSPKTLPRTPY